MYILLMWCPCVEVVSVRIAGVVSLCGGCECTYCWCGVLVWRL